MCDYSLHNVKSRPARVGDKLTTRNFGTGTRGFSVSEDMNVAVCVLPGRSCPSQTKFVARARGCGLRVSTTRPAAEKQPASSAENKNAPISGQLVEFILT